MFEPGNLLDGARRQKDLPDGRVTAGCLLDMDGELVERLVASGRAALDRAWPCFHTKLYRWKNLAMGRALRRPVTCLAHVTNAMATRPEDFEKGGHDGQEEALDLCARAVAAAVAYAHISGAGKDGKGP